MQILKAIFLLSCLLLLGPGVNADGLDLYKASDCSEIAIEGAGSFALRAIPWIKELATCAKFSPAETDNLDPKGLLRLLNDFLREAISHQKCLLDSLDKVNTLVKPFVIRFSALKCLPRI